MSKCQFWLIPIVIVFIFCSLVGAQNALCKYDTIKGDNEMYKQVIICFSGEKTDMEGYAFRSKDGEQYILIPLVQVLESVGIEFLWDSVGDAYFIYKNRQFCLSPEKGSFFPCGSDWKMDNRFELPPGVDGHKLLFKGTGRDFLVDMEYSSGILLDIGYRIHFSEGEDTVNILKVR